MWCLSNRCTYCQDKFIFLDTASSLNGYEVIFGVFLCTCVYFFWSVCLAEEIHNISDGNVHFALCSCWCYVMVVFVDFFFSLLFLYLFARICVAFAKQVYFPFFIVTLSPEKNCCPHRNFKWTQQKNML